MLLLFTQVGVDSTGKLTNSSLACYVADCELAVLSIRQNYNHSDFQEELKKFFKQTGVNNVKTVLLLTDEDLIKVQRKQQQGQGLDLLNHTPETALPQWLLESNKY
ncbi:hypothetical protein chiPu_0026218 [Chiloscyllium punctatum]|uniref:Dynein heavy chain AAA module D4 domain-containing protein n=1 Tax=Chiloscyllium punctatum TaxID=137246 RepID=A0A401TI90_CHIPU|nr:hypothetical protein [Chiloscyllium punctatum]